MVPKLPDFNTPKMDKSTNQRKVPLKKIRMQLNYCINHVLKVEHSYRIMVMDESDSSLTE